MNVSTIKKLSKKSLSVLLSIIMIMSTMSVSFGAITAFAAGGDASEQQWATLAEALKADTIAEAAWSGSQNNYAVDDPDGSVSAAVEAYFDVFNTLANRTPATGHPNNTSNSTGSNEGNRTINQVNTTIKNEMSSRLGSGYTEVENFLNNLVAGAGVTAGTGETQTKGGDTSNDKSVPATDLTRVSDITITVKDISAMMDYTLENLPDSVVMDKVFTVKHANDRYDYTYDTGSTGGCSPQTTYTRTYSYFYYISAEVVGADGAAESTAVIKNTADTLSANAKYFDMKLADLIKEDIGALNTAKDAVTAAKAAVVAAFGITVWKHFFGAYDVDALSENILMAIEVYDLSVFTSKLNELKDTDYAEYSEDELRALHGELTANLFAYGLGRKDARDVIENGSIEGLTFDPSDIKAVIADVNEAIQIIAINELKATIDNKIATYDVTALSGTAAAIAKGTVDGYIASINTYPAALVDSSYVDMLNELSTALAEKVAAEDEQFVTDYVKYITDIYCAIDQSAASADLVAANKEGYNTWYSELQSLLASKSADANGQILAENNNAMKARMQDICITLYARVKTDVNNTTALYNSTKKLNGSIDLITVSNYSRYKQAFKTFDKDTYNYLMTEADFPKPADAADVIAKYDALVGDYTVLENFIKTGGFSKFEKFLTEYVDRMILEGDIVRDKEYEVDADKAANVIDSIDKLLTSNEIAGLLGGLLGGEEEGAAPAAFSISDLVKGLISDMLFTDATINMIMQMLFSLIMSELVKLTATNDMLSGLSLNTISKDLGLPLYPDEVADMLDAKYADNKTKLKSADTNSTYDPVNEEVTMTPWTNPASDLVNDDGTLTLTWGVDAAKEAGMSTEEVKEVFYQAFDDALHCLKPLLNVLVANKPWTSGTATIMSVVNLSIDATACPGYANLIVPIFEALGGRVEGTNGALFTFKSPKAIEDIAAKYSSAISDNSAADLLRSIVDPLFNFIDVLGAAPLKTLVSILPTLCYALSMQMVPELLGQLGTVLKLNIDAGMLDGCVGDVIDDALDGKDVIPFSISDMLGDFNIDVVDLSDGINSLLAVAGLSLPRIEQGQIAQMGTLGKFTSARYASHYDKDAVNASTNLGLGDNEAVTVKADNSAVIYYLLQYIFELLGDSAALEGLLTKLAPADGSEEGAMGGILDIFKELDLCKYGSKMAAAAVIELFAPQSYENAHLEDWYVSAVNPNLGTEPAPFSTVYLKYSNDWTQDKAKALINSLPELLTTLLPTLAPELATEGATINELLQNTINGAFTNEAVTTLILGIAKLGASGLDPMVVDLLAGVLGGDITEMYKVFGYLLPAEEAEEPAEGEEAEEPAPAPLKPGEEGYVNNTGITAAVDAEGVITWSLDGAEFVDGDRDAFMAIVLKALGAFVPTIHKLISGQTISALGAINIDCAGVYGGSLEILLKDVLGIAVPSEADLAAETPEAALLALINAVFGWLDEVLASENVIVELLEIVPNLLYFIESNGLSVVIRNLLHPILVLLDTLRPVIDISLNGALSYIITELVTNKELSLDINALLPVLLSGSVPNNGIVFNIEDIKLTTILGIVDRALGTNLVCSPIATHGLDAMFAFTEAHTYANGDEGYKATTSVYDAVTVLVSALIETLSVTVDGKDTTNADVIFSMIEDENVGKAVTAVLEFITGFEYEYKEPNWDYLVENNGGTFPIEAPVPSIAYLDYQTDWTEDKAAAVYAALDEILVMVLPEILKDSGAENLADFVNDMLTTSVFTDENLTMIVEAITNLLISVDANLFKLLDVMLDTNIAGWFDMVDAKEELDEETGETVTKYKVKDTVNWGVNAAETYEAKREAFIAGLERVLQPAEKLIAFLLFGDGYAFFTGSKQENNEYVHNNIITLNGGEGYERGLVPIFEALGLEMKPASAYLVDGEYDVTAAIKDILDQVFGLIAILENAESTVAKVFELLPNLIYFINADGIKTSVNNILSPINTLIGMVGPMIPDLSDKNGDEVITIADLFEIAIGETENGEPITLDISNLTTEALLAIAGANGVKLSPELLKLITELYVGDFKEFTSANGLDAYKLDVAGYEHHVLTIVLSLVLDLVKQNAELFSDLLGDDVYAIINALLTPYNVNYQAINWGYMYEKKDAEGNVDIDANNAALADGFKAVTKFQYLEYATDWTPEKADAIYAQLNSVITYALGEFAGGSSIAALLQGVMEDKLYTDANLKTVVELIVNALANLDVTLRDTISVVIEAEGINKWFKEYCVPGVDEKTGEPKLVCTKNWGVDNAEDQKAVFVEAIKEILQPANRLLGWLFFEDTFTFFKSATGETLITLQGGKGYDKAIVPIFEALGCDLQPASTYYDAETGTYKMENAVATAVANLLDSALALIDDISKNPAQEVMALIPNLLYFINADGLVASVNNLLAPVEALFGVIAPMIPNIDAEATLAELIDGLVGVEISNLNTENVLALLAEKAGFEMNDDMKAVIKNIFALGVADDYSSKNGETAYRVDVTGKEYDVLTVLLSFAIDAFKLNKALFAGLLPEGVYDAVVALIAGINIDAAAINWAYMYSGNMDELERKGFPGATIKYLDYSTDWTADAADSVYAALADILDLVLPLVLKDKNLYNLVNDLIAGNLYKTENLETIVELIVNLLAGFDTSLRNAVGAVLDVNIASWFSMCEDEDEDGKYEVIPGKLSGNNRKDFIAGLKTVLEPAEALLNWLFFGESYTFFNGTTSEVLITVNGGKGYAYGILPILEALGVEGLQKEYRDDDGKLSATLAVEVILNKVLDLVDAKLTSNEKTVEFAFTLIPNLLYFINADGLKASVNNLVAPVDAIIGCLSDVVGAESIAALLTETIGFDISNLETRTLLTLLEEKTGFVMNPGMRGAIYNIYEVGKAQKFTSVNGKPAYKLVPDMGDALTVILSFVLDAFNLNKELFVKLLKDENIYNTVDTLIRGLDVLYTDINWGYMYEKDTVEANNKALAEGGFPAVSLQYLEYSTDWTEKSAEAVYGELNDVLAYLLGEFAGGNTIAQLLSGVLNNNVYTDANLNAIVELIVNAIFSLDAGLLEIIGGVDSLLDADINVWKKMCTYNEEAGKYECTKAWGVDGAADKKAAFVAGLKEVLAPANELLAWLFFEDDYTFFNGTTNNPLITISGGKGYELGLVPILEALGCEIAPAESFYDDVTETYDVGAAVESILNSALKLVDKVSENPAKEAMTLIPNLLYFINADGLKESVNNLLAPVNAVISALSGIVDVDSLGALLEKVVGFNVENLSTETLLGLLVDKTGFVMNEDMKQVIYDIYGLGTADDFTSANGKIAYRVDVREYDALTAILSFAIDAFKLNKALFAGLLPEGVYDAIVELIAGINIDAAPINWAYMYSGNMDELERKGFPGATIKYLEYSTDWTAEAADSVYAVLDDVLTLVLDAVIENGDLKKLVNDLIAGNLYKTENLETIVELIVNLLAGFDESLRNVVDAVLDVNIASWFSMCEDEDKDGKYEVIPGKLKGDTRADFIAGLKTVLEPAEALLNWLFFGESYTFFNGTTSEVLITVNGGKGYAYGILPILEALGVEGLQKEYRDADGKLSTTLAVEDILNKVLDLVDAKLKDSKSTVEFAFTLIPNLLYFINSDGLKVSVNNLVAPVDAVIRTLSGVIGEESLAALLTDVIGIDISNLETRTLLTLLEEKTGFVMNPGMRGAIYNIYEVGKAQKFTSVNGKPAYKLVPDMGDALTVILSFALDAFNLNKALFADLLGGEDKYDAIYKLIRGAKEQFVYQEIDWGYMFEGTELADRLAALEGANGKMPKYPANTTAANYLLYKNNWNKDTAKYVNEVVDSVIAGIMGETSLGQMLDDAITNGFYRDSILNSLISLVVGFAVDYAEIIEGAGVLLGAESISKWFSYCVVAEDGTVTVTKDFGVDEAATNDEKRAIFVESFVEVLEPAYGLLAWLLFDQEFTFFNGSTNDPLITLTGGRGYEEALVPLFEAVGAKMPGIEDAYTNGKSGMRPAAYYELRDAKTGAITGYNMEAVVRDLFSALTGWLSQICGDLANQGEYGVIGAMLGLLPNVIYNINAGTVKAVVNNLLLPVEEILGHLETFGLTVDFSTLLAIRDRVIDITDLDWYSVFDILETFYLYWPEKIQDFLATLYIGEAVAYESANGKTAYYMTYNADDEGDYLVSGRDDMITLVISFVIDAVLDTRNEARLVNWLGASRYYAIYDYLAGNVVNVPMTEIDWELKEYADTDTVVSPITLGAKINSEFYGELYTREMGEYIEKWLPSFVDSMIVLLGVQSSETGENYEGLSDILDELIGTSLYTTENLQKILDLIKGLLPMAEEALGAEIFEVAVNVLDKALGIDLTYWNDYAVADIATGDREAFVAEIIRMLKPVYPILGWLLTDENLVALFTTGEGKDALVIEGAEGYAYGIIPLLEAFDYDSELILEPDVYKTAAYGDLEDKTDDDLDKLLENILNPVLDVVDTILADPVNEIFNVLPGVLYFVNTNGLDAVIRNTLNAVETVVEKLVNPIIADETKEIDIYELIGLDAIANIDLETLISELMDSVEANYEESYGTKLELTEVAMEALEELTVGKLISYDTKSKLAEAYTVVYATGADRVDMVTAVLRLVLTFVSIPENVVAIEALLADKLDGEGYKFLCSLLENFSQMAAKTDENGNKTGMDEIMYTVYQIFYAANVAAHSTENWLAEFNGDYSFLNQLFATSDLDFLRQIEVSLGDLLNKYTGDIIDDDEIVPNGFIAFFQKIADFFKKIGEFFKNLFK